MAFDSELIKELYSKAFDLLSDSIGRLKDQGALAYVIFAILDVMMLPMVRLTFNTQDTENHKLAAFAIIAGIFLYLIYLTSSRFTANDSSLAANQDERFSMYNTSSIYGPQDRPPTTP